MSFSSWMRNWKRSIESRSELKQTRRPKPAIRRLTRPRLEVLEDRNLPSAYVVTTTADGGSGSLRDAIIQINAVTNHTLYASPSNPNADEIDFNITAASDAVGGGTGYNATTGIATITPVSALPYVTNAVLINGYTQSGASENILANGDNAVLKIELNGANVPGTDYIASAGLVINADNSTVQGLAINSFGGTEIYATGDNDTFQGNFIGTDVSGTMTPFTPNLAQNSVADHAGIQITGADNVIGTNGDGVNDPAERNVIAGENYGVTLRSTHNSVVAGNFIGTDVTGTHALPNWVGIGILVVASGDRIGTNGTDTDVAGERNIISGNAAGIAFGTGSPGPAESNGQVAGNSIGVDVNGNPLGNTRVGVFVGVSSSAITIGGTQANLANTIANTQSGPGVWILNFRGSPTGIRVQGNSIYNNGGLGIDLGGSYPTPGPDGVTLNDSQGHSGPNNFQNFPVLTAASSSATSTVVTGTFSEADEQNKTVNLDFYANPTADPSGYGQGQTYLGSQSVYTDNSGNANFTADLAAGNLASQWITATATDPNGNTSEFSLDIQASSAPSQTFAQNLLGSLPQSSVGPNTMTIQADPTTINDVVSGLSTNILGPSVLPVSVYLNLASGTYQQQTVQVPQGMTLYINGVPGTTIDPDSSAFTVTSGNVVVSNVTFVTTGDAPTILVTGGSLTLRNDDVENTDNAQADISLTGGSLDMGTAADPGGNIFDISGTGTWFQNTTSNSLVAVGDTFEINGTLQPATTPTISVTDGGTYNGSAFPATAAVAGLNGVASNNLQGVGLMLDYQQLDSEGNVITDLGDTAPSAIGTYKVTASYAGSPNYLAASKSTTFTIAQAVPIFSLVAPPAIIDGTSNTPITGSIAAGSLIPPSTETVTVTINGVNYVTAIKPDGTFAVRVPTASLGTGSYTIGYFYVGDHNFTGALATANMDVTNGVLALFNQSQAKHAGSTIPIQIELVSASGQDLSLAGTTVTALGIAATTDTTDTTGSIDPSMVGALQPVQAAGNSNPNNVFREQGGSQPFYMYNLKTPMGLTAGTYRLYFQVQGDPLWHWVTFSVD